MQDFITEGIQQGPKGCGVRPKRPNVGVEFLGRGSEHPPYQLGCLGSTVSSPSGVRSLALAAQQFSYILSDLHAISCCILGDFCTKKLCSAT